MEVSALMRELESSRDCYGTEQNHPNQHLLCARGILQQNYFLNIDGNTYRGLNKDRVLVSSWRVDFSALQECTVQDTEIQQQDDKLKGGYACLFFY